MAQVRKGALDAGITGLSVGAVAATDRGDLLALDLYIPRTDFVAETVNTRTLWIRVLLMGCPVLLASVMINFSHRIQVILTPRPVRGLPPDRPVSTSF